MKHDDHVLLTGGTGFFGLALLRHWAQQGEAAPQLTVLTRNAQRFAKHYPELAAQPRLQWWTGDVLQPASLPHHLRFSHVLHAAADSTLGPQLTPLQRFDQILEGTRNLLELAVHCGAQRFLLTSSGGVYGRLPAGLQAVSEDCMLMPDPLNPAQAYGVAKRAAEHLCALFSDRIEVVIARCFAFVGRDLPLDVHFAIGNFIRDAMQGEAITVQGDGSPLRSYLDQRDLADWLLALLERGRPGQAYNVGSPEAVSIAELACRVRNLLAPGKPVRILGEASKDGLRSIYVPDVSKIERELGLRVRIELNQAIQDAARR